jgi:hypothetical protein
MDYLQFILNLLVNLVLRVSIHVVLYQLLVVFRLTINLSFMTTRLYNLDYNYLL